MSQNNLSGKIPKFLDRWNSLEFLNLSFNDFEGEVPVVGVFANASAFSVLGNNRLCGGLVTLELPKCKETGSKKKRLLGTELNQNISTGVKGTIGYTPPEYGLGSEMTSSGDVYSFGILLLEVMTGKKPTDNMFNEGLSLHKFAYMALPDHVVDVIENDAIVLQCTEGNVKKVKECLAAIIKIGVSCSVDSPPHRMKIEIIFIELQRILDVLQNI
nr:leucine-rich repeat protein [Tanacetum cinerariifolium]